MASLPDGALFRLGEVLFYHSSGAVNALAFSPDGKQVAAGSGKDIRLWEVSTGKEIRKLRTHTQHVAQLAFLPGGDPQQPTLVSASHDGTIRFWNAKTGGELEDRRIKHPTIAGVLAVSPHGKLLAMGAGPSRRRIGVPHRPLA